VFLDFTGCCALTCGRCDTRFCAFCLAGCGRGAAGNTAAHAHVRARPQNPAGDLFCREEVFGAHQRQHRAQARRPHAPPLPAPCCRLIAVSASATAPRGSRKKAQIAHGQIAPHVVAATLRSAVV
jgi:hypothetical protein